MSRVRSRQSPATIPLRDEGQKETPATDEAECLAEIQAATTAYAALQESGDASPEDLQEARWRLLDAARTPLGRDALPARKAWARGNYVHVLRDPPLSMLRAINRTVRQSPDLDNIELALISCAHLIVRFEGMEEWGDPDTGKVLELPEAIEDRIPFLEEIFEDIETLQWIAGELTKVIERDPLVRSVGRKRGGIRPAA